MHAIRVVNLTELANRGFVVAESLPWAQLDEEDHWRLRPTEEIAGRLLALDAVFTWVAAPEQSVSTRDLNDYIERSDLTAYMTPSEQEIVSLSRQDASNTHIETIGWRLENMWSLAWVLGFDPQPPLGDMIDNDVIGAIINGFIPRPGAGIAKLTAKSVVRPLEEIVALEDFFYCAHNAVRSAQLGGNTVPQGFHPIADGGTVHERRVSLTWCISPGTAWDDTDVST